MGNAPIWLVVLMCVAAIYEVLAGTWIIVRREAPPWISWQLRSLAGLREPRHPTPERGAALIFLGLCAGLLVLGVYIIQRGANAGLLVMLLGIASFPASMVFWRRAERAEPTQ